MSEFIFDVFVPKQHLSRFVGTSPCTSQNSKAALEQSPSRAMLDIEGLAPRALSRRLDDKSTKGGSVPFGLGS